MRLNAQRVNRHVFFANAPKHGQDGLALSFLLGRVGFDTVIVICEERGRIGFGGGAEGELDVILADIFQPDGVDHVVVVVVVAAMSRSLATAAASKDTGRAATARAPREFWTKHRRCMGLHVLSKTRISISRRNATFKSVERLGSRNRWILQRAAPSPRHAASA